MAGFREFMPGQIWFYYNAAATKDQERKKELGSITSRPVVIIQSAFYPEWNDIVTVCPMTHSDRRSGVYIDSTICKDGSLIEGGTVLPYLFYNVKTKFLFPMIATNHKRKLLSLSAEDYAKVRQGYLYHLGEDVGIPEYVQNWKHVNGYDRDIILKDVHLAINDYEDIGFDGTREEHRKSKKSTNPLLVQTEATSSTVENHIIASLSEYDRKSRTLYDPHTEFTAECIGEEKHEPDPSVITEKKIRHNHELGFSKLDAASFAKMLRESMHGVYPLASDHHIYEGSKYLEGVELKQMTSKLSTIDQLQILNMTIADIVKCTGIGSKSTASRLRKEIRESDFSKVDDYLTWPEPFRYEIPSFPVNKSRTKRNALRRYYLFSHTREELAEMIQLDQDVFYQKYPEIPRSYYKAFIDDAKELCENMPVVEHTSDVPVIPPAAPVHTEAAPAQSPEKWDYALWETLSNTEIREILSTRRKNMPTIMKNFGITREEAHQLWVTLPKVTCKHPCLFQPEIDLSNLAESCKKLAMQKYTDVSSADLLAFCRTDPIDIAKYFGTIKCANTPGKASIRFLKREIRKLIVRK